MRIGFDTRFITARSTGLGRFCRSLLQSLISHGSHDFRLFTPDPLAMEEFSHYQNVDIVPVPARLARGRIRSVRYEQLWLAKALAAENLDLVHYPHFLAPMCNDSPFILTIHDMDTFNDNGRHSVWTRLYQNRLITALAARSSIIVTDSEFSRLEILRHVDVPAEKVNVIYPGVFACPEESPPLLEDEPEYVLYTGGLGMRKNLKRMVEAFAQARTAVRSPAKLVITGCLAEVGLALKRYVEKRGLGEKVVFTGYVSEANMPGLYKGAAVVLYPSLYEGFGFPVLEAMAAGVPVITSEGSSMEEIAGGRALLVDPGNVSQMAAAIGALLSDLNLARRLGELGPRRASEFSWDRAAKGYLRAYEQVAARC